MFSFVELQPCTSYQAFAVLVVCLFVQSCVHVAFVLIIMFSRFLPGVLNFLSTNLFRWSFMPVHILTDYQHDQGSLCHSRWTQDHAQPSGCSPRQIALLDFNRRSRSDLIMRTEGTGTPTAKQARSLRMERGSLTNQLCWADITVAGGFNLEVGLDAASGASPITFDPVFDDE